MNIAIVHYHLNRGGVTQVVVNHLRSLEAALSPREPQRVVIFYGGRRQGWPETLADELAGIELQLVEVPSLDYDEGNTPHSERLATDLLAGMRNAGLRPADTVVHVHNHSLGKNTSLPGALANLARAGHRLLLHIHDFAEDFRPENYGHLRAALGGGDPSGLAGSLYPQAEQIHYAALNRRDFDLLAAAGVAPHRLHLVPNPVFDPGELPDRGPARRKLNDRFGVPEDRKLLLYPVRGIRRKNVGEALLWAALAEGRSYVGLTLEPLNPVEQTSYRRWCALSDELKLPCVFGLGETGGLSFQENLACADAILTTSVAEGFGMVFAETWLAGRVLLGRDLPDITRDFVDAGMKLDLMQPRFDVPLSVLDTSELRRTLIASYAKVLAAYGRSLPSERDLDGSFSELIRDDKVDFAVVPPTLQDQIVRKACTGAGARNQLRELNPWMDDALQLSPAVAADLIEHNADVVRTGYSLAACGRKLASLYATVVESRCGPLESLPCGNTILDTFLGLERLRPLRTAS